MQPFTGDKSFSLTPLDVMRSERRGSERHRVRFQSSTMIDDTGDACSIKVIDLSSEGCLLQRSAGFTAGSMINIRIGDEPAKVAKVVWAMGQHGGCQFDHPVEGSVIRKISLPNF